MANYDEHKVSITLSNMAYRIIESDMKIFHQHKFGRFINTVITEYKDESIASIRTAARNERERITLLLHPEGGVLSKSEEATVDLLVASYAQSLRERIHSYKEESHSTRKVRINKENFDVLSSDGGTEYYDKEDYLNAGSYIKALLEDYARQTFTRREGIVFKSIINTINNCKEENRILKVSYTGRDGTTTTYKHKPYKVIIDEQNGYHYYLGLSYDGPDSGVFYPMRVSRISDLRPTSMRSHITEKEKHIINESIKEKGVSYISGDIEVIEVELTPAGVNLYNSIFHLRPVVSEEPSPSHNGNQIYKFNCTKEQIRNYFFQFGKEAIILTPQELRNEFLWRYKEASNEYECQQ